MLCQIGQGMQNRPVTALPSQILFLYLTLKYTFFPTSTPKQEKHVGTERIDESSSIRIPAPCLQPSPANTQHCSLLLLGVYYSVVLTRRQVFDRSSLADVRQGFHRILYVLSADGRELKHSSYPEWKLNIRFQFISVIVYILCIMAIHKQFELISFLL